MIRSGLSRCWFTLLLTQFFSLAAATAQLKWEALEVVQKPKSEEATSQFIFTAKNTGKEAVEVVAITPTCGCLSAESSHESVPPEGKVTITATMEFGQMQGEQRKNLIVTSKRKGDHPEQRDTLETVVHLETFFQLEGNVAKFIQGTSGQPHTAKIKVIAKQPIYLKLGKISSEAVTATLQEKVAGREYELSITPQDLSKKGLGSISLTSDSAFPRAKQVDIFYTIMAPRKP